MSPTITWAVTRRAISADLAANRHDLKARTLLVLFRLTQLAMGSLERPRPVSFPLVALYRFVGEVVLGTELRPKTPVGAGLALHHGFGVVVNKDCRIGERVTLRHGVTLGHKAPGGPCPVIEDGVVFGAHAVVLGGVTVGAGSVIGAGVVLTRSVPPGSRVRAPKPEVSESEAPVADPS